MTLVIKKMTDIYSFDRQYFERDVDLYLISVPIFEFGLKL